MRIATMLGLTLVIWAAALGASKYIADQPLREHGHEIKAKAENLGATNEQQLAKSVVEMREQVAQDPDSSSAKTKLGYALLLHGVETGSGAELIEALKLFDEALVINPKEEQALIGIASVSLRVGVLDKAVNFYGRYLELQPNDVRALSDYALGLLRLGRFDEAEKALEKALTAEPESVPVLMVFAMLERERGETTKTRELANRALAIADDERSRASISHFLAELSEGKETGVTEESSLHPTGGESVPKSGALEEIGTGEGSGNTFDLGITEDSGSAADILKFASEFFSSHSIIGPKFRGVLLESEILSVTVADFPVEHMPEVAKQRFSSRITEEFLKFKASLRHVDILDQKSKKQLMRITLPESGSVPAVEAK